MFLNVHLKFVVVVNMGSNGTQLVAGVYFARKQMLGKKERDESDWR